MDVSLNKLSVLKQAKGESFTSFLQRWWSKPTNRKWTMPEEQTIFTIIDNLEKKLAFHLKVQCITPYNQLIPKVLNIERVIIAQGGTPTCL